MKITPKILSIPPYISTKWENVSTLRVENALLVITLQNGKETSIPDLSDETITTIFSCHTQACEKPPEVKTDVSIFVDNMKTGLKDLTNMLGKISDNSIPTLGKVLEHDPTNANLPDLPPEMIQKAELLLNIIPKEDILEMPDPEIECNCMYCQITRNLRHSLATQKGPDILEEEGEHVEETELEFSEWVVEHIENKLYHVINKLDPKEEYRVFLGNPIGCTCGKNHCEHILAVLRS